MSDYALGRPAPTSKRLTANGISLHYMEWGEPGGSPSIVLVHGGRDHSRTWDDVVDALRSDWHVVAPDLRGHGDSEWARGGCYALWDYVADLDAFLRQAVPADKKPVLVGHSLGGAICLQLAGVRSEIIAGVIAMEPFGMGPDAAPELVVDASISHDIVKVTPVSTVPSASQRLLAFLGAVERFDQRRTQSYVSIDDGVARQRAANPRLSPETAMRLVSHGMTRGSDGTYNWKFDNRVRINSPYSFSFEEARDVWNQITVPVVVLNGELSGRSGVASAACSECFRDFRSLTVPGAAHMMQHDQPEIVANEILHFVDTLPRV